MVPAAILIKPDVVTWHE